MGGRDISRLQLYVPASTSRGAQPWALPPKPSRDWDTTAGVKPLQHTSMQLILHTGCLRANCFSITRVPAPLARAGFQLRQEGKDRTHLYSKALVGGAEDASSLDQTAVRCKVTNAGGVTTANAVAMFSFKYRAYRLPHHHYVA